MQIKILVVDDSASDRMIISNMLEEYNVYTASDGVEAMRMLEEHEGINLMILDLKMPNMDGFQVLEALKEDKRYRKLRTIILTNYDELDNEIRGLKMGAVDYIRKPIHMYSLKVRIEVHIALMRAQYALEKQLTESERIKSTILSHLPGMAYSCKNDRNWTMQYVSSGCYKLTGYTQESLINNRDISFNELIAPEYRELLWKEWQNVVKNKGDFRFEYEIITASGERKWVLELGQGIYNDKDELEKLEGIIIDITDKKAIEDALKYCNEHDSWTGLLNRSYLENLLQKDLKKHDKTRRALICINLSDIQKLTLSYGFHYMQGIIKKVAQELSLLADKRRSLFITYVNRFVFYIMDYTGKQELSEFCETIIASLESVLAIERVGGGLGVYELDTIPAASLNVDQILKNLLIASEKAIEKSHNDFRICYYDSELEKQIIRDQEIEKELHLAETDPADGGLYLQYQPILDLRTNRICEFEALARLNSNSLGLVPPMEFIPIAERSKLIIPLGYKIFRQAFQFLNKLKENGYGKIRVSVNVSILQLLTRDFCENLLGMIREMQISPDRVGIEITESIFSSNYTEINNILVTLKKAGLYISIDDFGTGYSSLARESELNVDYLKVDKYFTDRMLANPGKSIVADIISMAYKLDHCTIAEGVESREQVRYLKEYGCDKIQGYIISRPLDEKDAIEFLKKHDKSFAKVT